jgi:hypothetical protein
MKFDPARDIPPNCELAGMSPIAEAELEKLRELQQIRTDSMARFHEMQLRAFELQRNFSQAEKVLDGRLIELSWKYGWSDIVMFAFDDENGVLYGLKAKPEAHAKP